MKVFIYRNLNRKGCVYSIKAVEGRHRGLVLGYASHILVAEAQFKVSEAGRQRVLANRRKNVHAGIVGLLLNTGTFTPRNSWFAESIEDYTLTNWYKRHLTGTDITYNPYKFGYFYERNTLLPVNKSDFVSLIGPEVRMFNGANVETQPQLDETWLPLFVPSVQSSVVHS